MKKLLSAALGAVLLVACLAAAPARAQVPADSVFGPKSPLKYHVVRYNIAAPTTNVTAAVVGALPPGGCQVKDIILTQATAGVGGTSWTATVKRNAVAVTSTDGGFTLAGGAGLVTNAAASPMGSLTNPTGGTRPVIAKDVAASGTVTVASGLTAGELVTIQGVTVTARASGAVNCEFNLGANENANAAALAAAINACTTYPVKQLVRATVAGAVVTVTARTAGSPGNSITFTDTGAHVTASGSGTLAGGFSAMSSGGELITADVTLTGTYSTGPTGALTIYCLPRN